MSFRISLKLALPIFTLVALSSARAAIPPKDHWLVGTGSQIGGIASGNAFTLMDLRMSQDKAKKVERIVMDMGDANGSAVRGSPGYFHVELKNQPQKLIIDLAQTPHSKVTEKQLAEVFRHSLAVRSSKITVDPVDATLTISLDLKNNTKARVLQVAGQKQTSKVVIDLVSQ